MSTLSVRYRIEPIRSLAAGSISGTYMGIGSAIDNPALQIKIDNNTDADLMFSIDGINDQIFMASKTGFISDVSTNKGLGGGLYLSIGTRLYVKEIGTPTTGSVYFSVFYGSDS